MQIFKSANYDFVKWRWHALALSLAGNIIHSLNLLRPIYGKTAAYGHFGRDEPEFSWETTDKVSALRDDAGPLS